MKLIFVHGRAQEGKDPVVLKDTWVQAWSAGLQKNNLTIPAGLTIEFPFYGDLLDKLVRENDMPVDIGEVLAKGELPAEDLAFFNAFLLEVLENSKIPATAVDEHIADPVRDRGPLNWGWVQAILKTLDRTPLGDLSIKKFTYDAFLYLTIPAIKRKINELVKSSFNQEPCVVVAHSLGTAVTYTLLSDNPQFLVQKYITLGSPLGLKSFTSKLTKPLAMPACVANGWYNAYDERDVVSLHPLDNRYFNISPAITNYNEVHNHTKNRHGIEGYLDDATVAKAIHDALQF